MRSLIILLAAVAYASADVNEIRRVIIPIVNQGYDIEPNGGAFRYFFDTANDINVKVEGRVDNINSDNPALHIEGGSGYTSPEGKRISTVYTAGVEGYRPQSDSIPTPPPTPPAILRLLAYLRARGILRDGDK